MSLDIITSIARECAGACQVGRDMQINGRTDPPCPGVVTDRIEATTDTSGVLYMTLCEPHAAEVKALKRADQITELVGGE